MSTVATQNVASGRVGELDSIRGLAAFAILITHLPLGFWFGETGVDLFFVLSGYLITSIIIKNLNRPGFYKTFFVRRSFRIWPIYYLSILGLLLLSLIKRSPSSYEGFWYYISYLQNVGLYWQRPTPPFLFSLGHTWTLAIEEQFYILWPLTLVIFGRRAILPLGVALIAAPLLFRNLGLDRVTLFGHSEGFGWGALLSCFAPTGQGASLPQRTRNASLIIFGVVGAAAVLTYAMRAHGILMTGAGGKKVILDNISIALVNLFYASLVGLLIVTAGTRATAPLRWLPLVYLGQLSYGLYLYHWILYEQIDTVVKFGLHVGDPYWLDLVKVVASFCVAVVSWHFVEQPILRIKDRFGYGSRKSPAPALT